jgi:mono/diheme cytochrome c family protein
MAATEQFYRNQKALDVVFGVSCVLMLLSCLWMYAQDYNREYKGAQRRFRDIEEAMNERLMLEKMPSAAVVRDKDRELRQARAALEKARTKLARVERELTKDRDIQDNNYRAIKAEYDSKVSYYDIAVEHRDNAPSESARAAMQREVDARRAEIDELRKKLAAAQADLDKTDLEIKQKVTEPLREPRERVARAEDDLKKLTVDFDRYGKLAAQRGWKAGDTFRALPILDAFESPTKIQQVWLPDLTIDYSFKDVPRFDRCVSCHLGIDRVGFEKPALARLGEPNAAAALNKKLGEARVMLERRQDSGEKLGFNIDDLPAQSRGSVWRPAGLVFLAAVLIALILGGVERSPRLAMAIVAVGALLTLGWGVALALTAPRDPAVTTVELTKGQVTQYCSHPRLDLYVDANSAHPKEKFGCSICHAGQGSATDFLLASHTPANALQEHNWNEEYGWKANHFWDYPMLSSRFVESSCLKCHHQVTDLVRHGSKEEAPKLLHGFFLVREMGCFGCHEISGIKSNREVGPDLRLEPSPALEYLSAADQEKAHSDPLNPPGMYRRVGPSLRRIAEKTNETWAVQWISAPRGFRPDTRMPHFYNLTNNSPEGLPKDQKDFPNAEIHSIAFYLFAESKANLEGKDTTRSVFAERQRELQGMLKRGPLTDRDLKSLLDVSRRLADIALLSSAARAREINAADAEQRRLQDRLQELYRKQTDLKAAKEDLSPDETKELTQLGKDLDEVTARLNEIGHPVPMARQLYGEDGSPVSLPPATKDQERARHAENGRRLFTEKGCLACHIHAGTEQAGPVPSVTGEADFGPNLSRLAAKIAPEVKDPDAARRWVVQWVMNPNVYHPRTRMPITHLSPADASDVAEWLLSQKADWKPDDLPTPGIDELVGLARVYLAKAPKEYGMTAQDVDTYLPATGDRKGIPEDRLSLIRGISPDADELRLEKVNEDTLRWYIGRKAISRLGCFGCHDIPGFEQSKPIGTALNDWGRKDPERLAFEDSEVFVRDHFHIAELRDDPKDPSKPARSWTTKDGRPPYEQIFFEALEHHQREGFLHLKLQDPRSYDYHRQRTWDDRLRMPQFRFSRGHRRPGESAEDFQERQRRESKGEYDDQALRDEAEAREAVMTFILGLVAEQVPSKYLFQANNDRLAEVKGRQVLDKFNCIGCHQVRSGVIEFKQTPESLRQLEEAHRQAVKNSRDDFHFPNHNAWLGPQPTSADRLTAFAAQERSDKDPDTDQDLLVFRLTDALRFAGADGVLRDIPAGNTARVMPRDVVVHSSVYGGTLAALLVEQYLPKKDPEKFKLTDGDNATARSMVPPTLIREGERVQPNWLYGFLLNPEPVRPTDYMLLRMPKFNMSGDEARTLVDYFAAASRLTNPGAGVTAQYLRVDQRDESFWRERTKEYVERLRKEGKLEDRLKAMEPAWEQQMRRQIAEAESGLEGARAAVKAAKDADTRKNLQKELDEREASIKRWKEQLQKKDFAELRHRWETEEAYATDAMRLLSNRELCMKCHSIGPMRIQGEQAPNLGLTANRLRPEWVEYWVANPNRMFSYVPIMPQNVPNNPPAPQYQDAFVGTPLQQVRGLRDVMMDLGRMTDLPGVRSQATPSPASGGK